MGREIWALAHNGLVIYTRIIPAQSVERQTDDKGAGAYQLTEVYSLVNKAHFWLPSPPSLVPFTFFSLFDPFSSLSCPSTWHHIWVLWGHSFKLFLYLPWREQWVLLP